MDVEEKKIGRVFRASLKQGEDFFEEIYKLAEKENIQEAMKLPAFESTAAYTDKIKEEINWIQQKGDDLLGSFILPPLQLIAASINFCTLLFNGKHLFPLPFKSLEDVADSRELLRGQNIKSAPKPDKRFVA